jgi:hypothetical protein
MKSKEQSSLSAGLLKGSLLMLIVLVPLNLQCFGANGAIAGRVVDESSNGLSNVEVRAFWPGEINPTNTALTDANGYYTILDLHPGSYKVLFTGDTSGGPTGYIWEFYNNKQSLTEADLVPVADGATTSDINAAIASIPADSYEPNNDLSSAYTLTTGTYNNIVADVEGGDSDWFKVYLEEGQDLRVATLNTMPIYPDPQYALDIDIYIYDSAGNSLVEATSNRAVETLYLSNVTAGWYYILIYYAPPCVLSLSVTAGDLEIGEITGHITNSLGAGVQRAKAAFYTWDNLDWSLFYANAVTDASGNYKFAFTPGRYRLSFDVTEALDPYVLGEWYNNQSASATSAIVSITAGQTTSGIDAQLADGAAISGQVTNQSSNPLALSTAIAYDSQGYRTPAVYTDASGNYTIGHIPVANGARKVRFGKGSYALEWWNDKSSFGTADELTLQERQTTTGINAQMAPQGYISGRVTDSQNNGIAGVVVNIYDTVQNLVPLRNAVTTDWNGYYTLSTLPTIDARVFFDAGRNSPNNSEYYTDKITFETADAVSVTAGQTHSDVNAQLTTKSITIREPDGGEIWCAGSARMLVWTNIGTITNVKIEYSTNNGRSFTTETASTPNTGLYRWIVPQLASTAVVIRISDASNPADYDDSNANIKISSGKCQIPADFNWDGASDVTVWRPSNGTWYSIMDIESGDYSAIPWGLSTDIPVSGDYDGDTQSDIAVWRPEAGTWFVLESSNPGSYASMLWGIPSDLPTPGDYDGDGKTDIAVWRQDTGVWYIWLSGTPGSYTSTHWGMLSDIPVPADYDGDGKVDIAVWRPSTGSWFILPSAAPGTYTSTQWGVFSDIPVPADYDGDFKSDIAVWRPSSGSWYFLLSASLSGTYTSKLWGTTGDKPAVGDYDADGKADIVVFRPDTGTWYAILSEGNSSDYVSVPWGMLNDQPITLSTRILTLFP